jgi:hypothetical protein
MTKPRGYWTKQRCLEASSQFQTRKDWQLGSGSSYTIARRNGWLEECCAHMLVLQKKWTLEEIIESAKGFKSKSEWIKGNNTSYAYAKTHGWLDLASSHMTPLKLKNGTWTKEACVLEAMKYKSKVEWAKHSPSSHAVAQRNGWISDCSSTFISLRKHEGYSKSEVIENAKLFQTRSEWRNSANYKGPSPFYAVAQRNGWLEECCEHMAFITKPSGYWNEKNCVDDAQLYFSVKEWANQSNGAYQIAARNGWLVKCTKHMKKLNISYGEYVIHKILTSYDIEYQEEKSFPLLKKKSTLFFDFFIPTFNLVIEFHGSQHYSFSKYWHKNEVGFQYSLEKDKIKEDFLSESGIDLLIIPYTDLRISEDLILSKIKHHPRFNHQRRELSLDELKYISSMCQWTKETILIDSKKYEFLKDWRENSPSAYTIALRNGWLEEVSKHLKRKIIARNSWTKEQVIYEAKKYKTRSEWAKNHSRTYKSALRNGWDKEACIHMLFG